MIPPEVKEAILRLELYRTLKKLWLELESLQKIDALSDLEADIWANITEHPAIQDSLKGGDAE